ncbi:hypothetical protein DFH06DRAFT_6699 [Mycena polygramma]|nr:hypothetical protein DFH06DRAFT_6699 [Mycena polygramma]
MPLVPDLLCEIMLALPLDIDQKFAFAQVSRLWRTISLDSPLFWSSFTGRATESDCYRVPLILERSGSNTMLHIELVFFGAASNTMWSANALRALVPYAARIETLCVLFGHAEDSSAVLNSNLEFPSLRTLRLKGPAWPAKIPELLCRAPRLQTLDVLDFTARNWGTLLSPSLEDISLRDVRGPAIKPFSDIFERCPRVRRVVLWDSDWTDFNADAFARWPLAPALRELELRLEGSELGRVLKTGFSDVVLPKLTGCTFNAEIEPLTALLSGVGPLVVFKLVDMGELVLHDEAGRIRRLQCWNEDSVFDVQEVWKHLSIHYGLHRTVREIHIRVAYWNEYLESFEAYPPQLRNGITLVIETYLYTEWSSLLRSADEGGGTQKAKPMQIPGLAKVEFRGSSDDDSWIETTLKILEHIEVPATRHVEVCISNRTLQIRGTLEQDDLVAFRAVLPGDRWGICSHCLQI